MNAYRPSYSSCAEGSCRPSSWNASCGRGTRRGGAPAAAPPVLSATAPRSTVAATPRRSWAHHRRPPRRARHHAGRARGCSAATPATAPVIGASALLAAVPEAARHDGEEKDSLAPSRAMPGTPNKSCSTTKLSSTATGSSSAASKSSSAVVPHPHQAQLLPDRASPPFFTRSIIVVARRRPLPWSA